MLHRRDAMIRIGQVGLGALTLPQLLRSEQLRAEAGGVQGAAAGRANTGRAKSCILIYLWGGPPQQDLWDMKPDAPTTMRSHFKPIATVTPGIEVCEHLAGF